MRMMNVNSISAFQQDRIRLRSREDIVVEVIERRGPATDRMVLDWLGKRDMNEVRPRINNAIRKGRLVKVGDTHDPVSGKKVRLVAVPGQRQQVMFGGIA